MIRQLFGKTQEHHFERTYAAYGMKWGYNAQLDKLELLLASPRTET
jgi:hypothetical protein